MKKKITILIAVLSITVIGQAQWSLTGNAGTTSSVNFVGTTDTAALVFKVNSLRSGLLDYNNQNTSFGVISLFNLTTGTFNTAHGYAALQANTTGWNNTAIGGYAMLQNTTGWSNTAVGLDALASNITASSNTAIGIAALASSNSSFNTAVGENAYLHLVTGIGNTAVGLGADVNSSSSFFSNTTALGSQTTITAPNQVRVVNSSVTSIGGVVGWTTVSDGRFKTNIQSNVPGLDFIKQLKPVTYTLNISALNKFLRPNGITGKDGKKLDLSELDADIATGEKIVRTGFIAQDVAAAAQKAGFEFDGIDKPKNDKDIYGLRYEEFVTPLVKAVQELSSQNDSLKTRISNLQSQINDMVQQLNSLKNNIISTSISGGSLAVLKQNSPNPFNNNTVINYYLPSNAKYAQLIVSSVNGQILKTISLSGYGEGQVTISAGELAAGSYIYTLTVDGQRIDSKQMILTR